MEAAWRAKQGTALELYAGAGRLSFWYKRRFQRVIRVDKAYPVGAVDFSCTAEEFIEKNLDQFASELTFVDFDDEGSPAIAIQMFLEKWRKYNRDIVLCLTDGASLKLRIRGVFDFQKYYRQGMKRKATRSDYENFDQIVSTFIRSYAAQCGLEAELWSSVRAGKNRVLYQTWLIKPSSAVSHF